MIKTFRPAPSGSSPLYANRLIAAIHGAFIGHEFDVNFLYPRGDQERLALQKRLVIGVIFSVMLFAPLSYLSMMPAIAFVVSLTPFLLVYYLKIFCLKGRLRKLRVALERVLPLLKLVVNFLLKIAGNEQDIQRIFVYSLQHVSPAENGSQFSALVRKMILGEPIERILSEFDSPSKDLNEFIRACSDVKAFPYLSDNFEAISQYKVFLKTLESRMVIIVAEAIFLPILASIVFAFQNLDTWVHLVFAAGHLLILKYLARFLINKDFSLLYSVGLLHNQSKRTLDDFISFLIDLGKNLKYHSPEKALMHSFTCITRNLGQFLGITTRENAWVTSFYDKLGALSSGAGSGIVCLILNLLSKFKDYASVDLAQLVVEIAAELKRQKEIEEEKINIMNAERFKVRILVACLTLILSALSFLFPLIAYGTNDDVLVPISMFSGANLFSVSIFLILNLFYNYTSCFYLAKLTGVPSAHKYAIAASLLFVTVILLGFTGFTTWL